MHGVLKLSFVNPWAVTFRKPISLTYTEIVGWHSSPPPHVCFFEESLVLIQVGENLKSKMKIQLGSPAAVMPLLSCPPRCPQIRSQPWQPWRASAGSAQSRDSPPAPAAEGDKLISQSRPPVLTISPEFGCWGWAFIMQVVWSHCLCTALATEIELTGFFFPPVVGRGEVKTSCTQIWFHPWMLLSC